MKKSLLSLHNALLAERCYGPYTRNGKVRYRKYKHELKNGEGLTGLEVFSLKLNQPSPVYQHLVHQLFGK